MYFEILQGLSLSVEVADEVSDNGREGKDTVTGQSSESVKWNQGTADTGVVQRVGNIWAWVAAITHNVTQ